jgi:hypothetical protein
MKTQRLNPPIDNLSEQLSFCYVAGLSYHDIDHQWDHLSIGTKLALVRQPDNKYDHNAIAVAFEGDYNPQEPEQFNFDFIIGYIPRSENQQLAAIIDDGYQLSAVITQLNRNAPYNKRLGITITCTNRKPRPSVRYRALAIESDYEFASMQQSLITNGFIHCRWRFGDQRPLVRPRKGEKIVIIHKRQNDTVLYLTTIGAVDGDAHYFVDQDDVFAVDDCIAYILFNSVGPIVVPNWALDFLRKDDIPTLRPTEKFLPKTAQTKLTQIFALAQH